MMHAPKLALVIVGTVVAVLGTATAGSATDRYQWNLPLGFPTPRVPADNPMSRENGRPRTLPLLRHAPLRQPDTIVLLVPSPGPGVQRRPAARHRLYRRGASAQLHEPDKRGLQRQADLGQPAPAHARAASPRPDVRRVSRGTRARRHGGRADAAPGGRCPLSAAVRRGVPRRRPAGGDRHHRPRARVVHSHHDLRQRPVRPLGAGRR